MKGEYFFSAAIQLPELVRSVRSGQILNATGHRSYDFLAAEVANAVILPHVIRFQGYRYRQPATLQAVK